MKISTKGRYGLRAVIDIAVNASDEPVALSEIAMRQNISISYLEQLIAKLKKAGIVNSIRGAKGGYTIAKDPNTISVGDVLRALEGDLNPVNCAEITGDDDMCNDAENCVTKYVWKRISDSINNTVNTLMLSELMGEGIRIKEKNNADYPADFKNGCDI